MKNTKNYLLIFAGVIITMLLAYFIYSIISTNSLIDHIESQITQQHTKKSDLSEQKYTFQEKLEIFDRDQICKSRAEYFSGKINSEDNKRFVTIFYSPILNDCVVAYEEIIPYGSSCEFDEDGNYMPYNECDSENVDTYDILRNRLMLSKSDNVYSPFFQIWFKIVSSDGSKNPIIDMPSYFFINYHNYGTFPIHKYDSSGSLYNIFNNSPFYIYRYYNYPIFNNVSDDLAKISDNPSSKISKFYDWKNFDQDVDLEALNILRWKELDKLFNKEIQYLKGSEYSFDYDYRPIPIKELIKNKSEK